jgi:uncharacterized iron-regulated membrane protein
LKLLRASTWLHKWVALVVGIQVLFWVAGGLVMTVIPIEQVRSEHHVAESPPQPLSFSGVLGPDEVSRALGVQATSAQLKSTPRGPVWTLTPVEGEPVTVSAATGQPLPAITEAEARSLAQAAYVGSGRVVGAVFFQTAPQETGREGPMWRVEFDDAEGTSFYLSPETGEVLTRRSDVWRFYDFFWRLHIMDLENGEDFNHPLIIIATSLTLSIVISGFILLAIRLGRDWKSWRAQSRASRGAGTT